MNRSDSNNARVALVTGGNRGIGLAIARRFLRSGHRVAVTYRSSPPDLSSEEDLLCVFCDVTDPQSVQGAVKEVESQLGPVEILVSNAGITEDKLMLRMSDDDFTTVLDANLTGGFRVAQQVARSMMRKRWGRIVFISSVVGLGGQVGQANYAASKAGLIGLARSLAKEFATRNVTVNAIAPGPIDTDMLNSLSQNQVDAMVDRVPLKRVGTPEEIAASVDFLTSEDASYITGVVLPVDGGISMG